MIHRFYKKDKETKIDSTKRYSKNLFVETMTQRSRKVNIKFSVSVFHS